MLPGGQLEHIVYTVFCTFSVLLIILDCFNKSIFVFVFSQNMIDLSLSTPIQDESVCQFPLDLVSQLLQEVSNLCVCVCARMHICVCMCLSVCLTVFQSISLFDYPSVKLVF